MINKKIITSYKLFFALLGFSAIITEISTLAERGLFNPVNFFSFFTIENNALVFLVLLLSALYVASGKNPHWLDKLRGATTMYIALVGIGFVVLLSGLENTTLTAVPWDNVVLHYIIPIAVFIDLLIDKPKIKLRFKQSLIWLLYPTVYVGYSLIRGAVVDWYPYPFLDPSNKGYVGIAVTSIALLLLASILTWTICTLSGIRLRRTQVSR